MGLQKINIMKTHVPIKNKLACQWISRSYLYLFSILVLLSLGSVQPLIAQISAKQYAIKNQAQGGVFDFRLSQLETHDDKYDSLQKAFQLKYYEQQIDKANGQKLLGAILAVAGGGMFIGGVSIMNKNQQEWIDTNGQSGINGGGFFLTLAGGAAIGVGIPVAVVGGNKSRKNKKLLNELKNNSMLSFRISENGAGLVLSF
jgi:hypothetical protein